MKEGLPEDEETDVTAMEALSKDAGQLKQSSFSRRKRSLSACESVCLFLSFLRFQQNLASKKHAYYTRGFLLE